MDELIEEILIRLPPEEPAYLVRATLVCKAWRTMLSDSSHGGFLRRYREFHGTPPMLGYLRNSFCHQPQFVAATSTACPPLSMPEASDHDVRWCVLDCRHGHVLITDDGCYGPAGIRFIVWDPITRGMHHLVLPGHHPYSCTAAAVLCAIDACDHLDCRSGPFPVVLVENHPVNEEVPNNEGHVAWASVYSLETDAWSAASTSIVVRFPIGGWTPSLLIGDALYFTSSGWHTLDILKYDLGSHGLSMIDAPRVPPNAVAMKAHDGGLGFVAMSGNRLYLMSRQATGAWARHKTTDLGTTLLPRHPRQLFVYGDGMDTVFITTEEGLFTLNLKSRQVRKVAKREDCYLAVPYMSFFTPKVCLAPAWGL
ncbi:hypothetical protein BS78_02G019400 [Paspalum vaginatum]|nr:hypothetical protein BS78_02G019400 [Paspalum vaginatum]